MKNISSIMLNLKSFLISFLFIFTWDVFTVNSELQKLVAMFVFGDSIYDAGNNNYLNLSASEKANYWPYGETFFKYPTGRFCDGRVIPDFIAMDVKLPLWRPYLEANGTQKSLRNGANFAAGGAHAIPLNNSHINLKVQLNFFKNAINKLRKEVGEAEAKKILMEAIYLSSIGGVDYLHFIADHPKLTQEEKEEYVKVVMGNITEVIKEIYEMGGRKFAFQNVGPMGCAPTVKQLYGLPRDECDERMLEIMQQHNNVLLKAVEELENHLQGFKYLVFDYYTSLYNIIHDPSKYGFKVADIACCGYGTYRGSNCGIEPYELCSNPRKSVYFDGFHPGEQVNILLSQLLWIGESTITAPYNLKQLFELQISEIDNCDEIEKVMAKIGPDVAIV